VIAHRYGLEDKGVEFPPAGVRPTFAEGATGTIDGSTADTLELGRVVDGLRDHPVGLFNPELLHKIKCGPRNLHLLVTGEVVNDPPVLTERLCLPAVVHAYYELSGSFSPAMVILTRPAATGFQALATRPTGEPLLVGEGSATGGGFEVQLWSVDAVGAPAVELTVALTGSKLSVQGRSALRAVKKRIPRPMPRTAASPNIALRPTIPMTGSATDRPA
jgi:hypothetical protein